jgi:mono/diheme cytochrome c family protein
VLWGGVLALFLAVSASWGQTQAHPRLDLAERLGCFACHALDGHGGNLAAPLDGIGARLRPPQLQQALTYPRQLHPLAQMPSYAYLPPAEQEALLKYLEGLK